MTSRRLWKRWGVALAGASLILCIVDLVWSAFRLSFFLTNPPEYDPPGPTGQLLNRDGTIGPDPRRAHGLAFSDVSFPTAGQATLRGWLVPAASDARLGVVTAHGRGSDRRAMLRHLPVFHELGVPTLLFDYREHGVSDGSRRGMGMGYREAEDIVAAVHFMKETVGVERVVVVGVSLGASGAILAAAADPEIDAVVAESPFGSMEEFQDDQIEATMGFRAILRKLLPPGWFPSLIVRISAWRQGIDDLKAPYDVVHQIAGRPILLIHGTGDTAVRPGHSLELYSRAGMPKDLWLADGAGHTQVFDRYPDEYRAKVSALITSVMP